MYAFGVWEGTGDPKFTGDSVVAYLFNLRVFELRTAFQTRNLCVKRKVSAMGEVSGKAWNTGGCTAQNTAISRGVHCAAGVVHTALHWVDIEHSWPCGSLKANILLSRHSDMPQDTERDEQATCSSYNRG